MLARTFVVLLLSAASIFAQSNAKPAGDYAGMLGPLHVKLHLVAAPGGKLTGTVDSPDQGMVGVPCADVSLNGQALSFTVPMVRGTFAGIVSSDASSISGMWNQGTAMPLNLTRVTAASTTEAAATAVPNAAQGPGEVHWDDYTFKFIGSGTMGQVYQNGKIVGSILTMNGEQQAISMPGTDGEKLKRSFADYKAFNARSHGAAPATTAASAASNAEPGSSVVPSVPGGTATTGAPGPVQFDDAAHTIVVPMPEGTTVTFAGNDVKIVGYQRRNYLIRHQKGSAGRVLERSVLHPDNVSTSISGGGEEFLHEGGGMIYDTGIGAREFQESPQIRLAKQLSIVAVNAVAEVRKVNGHEDFTPPGYNTLKEVSQYRLRSDGSR